MQQPTITIYRVLPGRYQGRLEDGRTWCHADHTPFYATLASYLADTASYFGFRVQYAPEVLKEWGVA